MLRIGAAIAVPTIIGQVDEDLCAVPGELSYFVRENGLLADEGA